MTPTTRFKPTAMSRALFTLLCGAASLGAHAQTAPAPAASTTLQRVEITGSNIRRADAETASAVQVISREDLDRSGKTTVSEYLQTLTSDNQGSVPMTFGNGFAKGGSGISLRGLGANSTLVLINGRRIAPYGLADDGSKSFADLNVIPLDAVERIDVLKDGASAIYGSDAIAGVVNIILRKSFVGTTGRINYGTSRYRDGDDVRGSVTHGFGDLDENNFNVMFNLELSKKDAIYYGSSKRANRAPYIGRLDGRGFGFDAQHPTGGGAGGGTGVITGPNAGGSSIVGNVRNPATNNYFSRGNTGAGTGFTRTFPGANCANFTNIPQGDPGGGCIIDSAQKYQQIQPNEKRVNLFTRGVTRFNADTEGYLEFNIVRNESTAQTTPSGINGASPYPGPPISNAGVALGPNHPDNPYFGSTARLRYLAGDVGPRVTDSTSTFTRLLAGVKGTMGAWNYDGGFLFSQTDTDTTGRGYLARNATFALLNPTAANVAAARDPARSVSAAAYSALPAGSYWRLAENGGLNTPELYAALSPTISADARSRLTQLDFKVDRELGALSGGPIGVAFGAEVRRETAYLTPNSGTNMGDIIGLGYSAYEGSRTVSAVYGEALFPVLKTVEITAAARYDHYSDAGNSFTPKVGAKWRPVDNLAVRGSFAKGFRAPGFAESGKGGSAGFITAVDPVRCAAGVQVACSANQLALVTAPNPNLEPEKSEGTSFGVVWDITPSTNVTADVWQIKRKNEINQEPTDNLIAQGRVTRDPSTAQSAADPGAINVVNGSYINSARTVVKGLDLEAAHRFDLGTNGRLTFTGSWTHLFSYKRTDAGTTYSYAGTHGNCDITNCIGTPKDRVSLGATWNYDRLSLGAVANYRGKLRNVLEASDTSCADTRADGTEVCKVASFTTVDLTARYKITDKTELSGGILNVFDKVAPFDPHTYGAVGYNPLDFRGAVGRFFQIGLKHTF